MSTRPETRAESHSLRFMQLQLAQIQTFQSKALSRSMMSQASTREPKRLGRPPLPSRRGCRARSPPGPHSGRAPATLLLPEALLVSGLNAQAVRTDCGLDFGFAADGAWS